MPTYDYLCDACGHTFEELQSITAAPLKKCPSCRKAKLRRLIGAGAGFIFKGSGFYQTDYKRSGSGAKDRSDKSDGGASGAPSDSKPSSGSGSAAAGDSSKPKPEKAKPAAG